MKNPLPCPDGDGAFFTLNLYGAEVGPDGVTRGVGNGISIAASPAGLARLLAAVRPVAVQALFAFLHEGDVALINNMLRVEVEGWGREWLTSRGYSSNQAQDAIRDLRDVGWIRTEQNRGLRGWVGPQVGVLSGSVYGSGEVYLAAERRNRRPANVQVKALDGTSGMHGIEVVPTVVHEVSLPDVPAPGNPSVLPLAGSSVTEVFRHRSTGHDGTSPGRPAVVEVGSRGLDEMPDGLLAPVNAQVTTAANVSVTGSSVDGPSDDGAPVAPSTSQYEEQSLQSLKSHESFQDLLRGCVSRGEPILTERLWQTLREQSAGLAGETYRPRAVDLICGVLLDTRSEYPMAAAAFLDLHHNTAGTAARAVADYVVAVLSHGQDDAGDLSGRIRAFARGKGIVVKDPVKSSPLLPQAWALAVLAASTTHMSDPRRYLYSALHRTEWDVREPLPRLAEAFDALNHSVRHSADPAAPANVVVDSVVLTPPVSAEEQSMLESVLDVMAEHFRAFDEDKVIWRKNARIRGMMAAQFTVSHNGITPEEYVRLQNEVQGK